MIITKEYIHELNPSISIVDEEWRPAYGYEDKLEISNYGNIRRLPHTTECLVKGKCVIRNYGYHIYSVQFSEEGYLKCTVLDNKEISCHRLVALTFLNRPDNYESMEVDHIDYNPKNPYYTNLQWVSPSKNRERSYRNVLRSNGRCVREIISGKVYPSITQFCRENDYNDQLVSYGLAHYNGYVPKYDICLEYYEEGESNEVIHKDTDMSLIFEGRASVIRRVSHQGVKCLTTGQVFPTAIDASKSLGLPSACVAEVLSKYAGTYKKKNLKFEYIDWSNASDEDIQSVVPHFLEVFKRKSGGNKHEKATLL